MHFGAPERETRSVPSKERKQFMTHRLFIAGSVFALSLILASPSFARWRIQFIPDEATGVTVMINGEPALTWKSSEGEMFKDVPAKFANLEKIHVRAEENPNGKTARVKVYWDDDEECDMRFDNGDDCDVGRSIAAPDLTA